MLNLCTVAVWLNSSWTAGSGRCRSSKISKRHFFQGIKNSLHGVTRMGLKSHQNFFQNFFSTNMVARGVQSFDPLDFKKDPIVQDLVWCAIGHEPLNLSGWKTRLKNFKTPFFSRYQKILPWGNSNMSKTSPKFFSKFFFNIYGR